MSSAKSGIKIFSLCPHIRKYLNDTFYRAKPVSEMERSGIELHDGVERRIYFIPRADTGAAPAPHVQPEKNHGIKIESNKNK